jgi:hypothetical protein
MNTELDPVVGNWYRNTDKDQVFRVVSFDEEEELVEIQTLDGDIEEIDASTWFDMDLEIAEAPEDWTEPLDVVETEEPAFVERSLAGSAAWQEPLTNGTEEDDDEWDEDEEDDEDDDEDWEEDDGYGSGFEDR